MKNKVIITLIFAFFLALFTLFNRHSVKIFIAGIQLLKVPLSVIVFYSFILGAGFAAILVALGGIKLRKTITRQKKLIRELESRNEPDLS